MGARPTPIPFNFEKRVDGNAGKLKPPVNNRLLRHGRDMIVMAAGGPNTRAGFHDDPLNEWFHQVRTCPDFGAPHPGKGQAPGGLVRL